MAIVKTRKITVYALSSQIGAVMDYLQRSGAFEPAAGAEKSENAQLLSRLDGVVSETDAAIEIIKKRCNEKKSLFSRRPRIPPDAVKPDRNKARMAKHTAHAAVKCNEQIKRNVSEIQKIDEKAAQLSAYAKSDLPIEKNTTAYTEYMTGSCRLSPDSPEKLAAERGVPVYIEELNRTDAEVILWVLYLKSDRECAEEFLAEIGFSEAAYAGKLTPQQECARLEERKRKLTEENDALEKTIAGFSKNLKMLELYHDRLAVKSGKYHALAEAENTDAVFAVSGYVPENLAPKMMSAIENKFLAAAEYEEPDEGEEIPVAFSNNAFASPVEEITASYAMPSADDIDPNPIMAVFYYWFFGMMFSDAGYGILMMIVCGILGFSQILESDKRRMFKMFFFCGVSTTVWGILYGSFFGDLIGTVSSVFGSGDVSFKPILIDPVNQALQLLIISVIFGMIHILTALGIKFYILWRKGNKKDAVFDIGLWILVLTGLSAYAAGMGLNIDGVKNIGAWAAVAGAAGLVLTGGRDKKNPVMRLLSGIMSLYDITGYVGDILSYSRLMALGLATGVIASVVNVLASLGGSSVMGAVIFVIISLVGHAINFSINMLGAYVHTNRLQYVEFYQKFYEGGGRRFRPLKPETKYFDFSDN